MAAFARPADVDSAAVAAQLRTPRGHNVAPRSAARSEPPVLGLQRLVGNHAVALSMLQRAGDYSGLLPDHDSLGGDYQTNDAAKNTDFTYHHIIPENQLAAALAKLQAVRAAQGEVAGATLEHRIAELENGGEAVWLRTRATNLAAAINREFSDFEVRVSADALHPLLAAEQQLDGLFARVGRLVRARAEARWSERRRQIIAAIKALLGDRSFGLAWRARGHVAGHIESSMNGLTYAGQVLTPTDQIVTIFRQIPYLAGPGTNKGAAQRAVEELVRRPTFDHFYRDHLGPLHSESVSSPTLKKLVRDKGLPRADQDKFKDSVEWLPGNLHRGPSSRRRLSGGVGWNELLDDGGDKFEKSAQNLVKANHYQALEQLQVTLEAFLNESDPAAQLTAAETAVGEMVNIQAYGLTNFDRDRWQPHGEKGVRVRPRDH